MSKNVVVALALGAVIVVGIVVSETIGGPSAQAAAPSVEPQTPTGTILALDVPAVTFPGRWSAYEQNDITDMSRGDDGSVTWQFTPITQDTIVVDESFVQALLDSGRSTQGTAPTDCRIMARWSQADQSLWWSLDLVADPDRENGDTCVHVTESESDPDDPGPDESSATSARYLIGGMRKGPPFDWKLDAGSPGTVTILSDGSVTIDASDQPNPGGFTVYASMGDANDLVYFWVQ